MNNTKRKLLYSGKVKSLFETDDPDYLIAEFRDDTTAFDGVKHELLENKGLINNRISSFIMEKLEAAGVPTHFEKNIDATHALVKKLKMIPVESVVRNAAAGSLCRRLGVEQGLKLDPPLLEIFLKSDELHDPLITEDHAIRFGFATREQLDQMAKLTLTINAVLTHLFDQAGMQLVDAKFEFGVFKGQVILGDEISPDSCRIWDKATNKILDKDRFRKDLGGVMDSYHEIAERLLRCERSVRE